MAELVSTGERLVTSIKTNVVTEHLHRYAIAMEYIKDKLVLDIACGEGYGSNLLAGKAKNVIGVDIAPDAVLHAKGKYNASNLQFLQGSASDIPLPENSIEVIISFETIEHHDKHDEMMLEFNRVLKKDGIIIISSPDKKYYTDVRGYNNPFHVKELYKDEFKELVHKYFTRFILLKQGYCCGTLMYPENKNSDWVFYHGGFNAITKSEDLKTPEYSLIIATNNTNAELTGTSSFFEADFVEKYYEEKIKYYEAYILKIKNSNTYKLAYLIATPARVIKKLLN